MHSTDHFISRLLYWIFCSKINTNITTESCNSWSWSRFKCFYCLPFTWDYYYSIWNSMTRKYIAWLRVKATIKQRPQKKPLNVFIKIGYKFSYNLFTNFFFIFQCIITLSIVIESFGFVLQYISCVIYEQFLF